MKAENQNEKKLDKVDLSSDLSLIFLSLEGPLIVHVKGELARETRNRWVIRDAELVSVRHSIKRKGDSNKNGFLLRCLLSATNSKQKRAKRDENN